MQRRPPMSTLTATLFPYTTLFVAGGRRDARSRHVGDRSGLFPPCVAHRDPYRPDREFRAAARRQSHLSLACPVIGRRRAARQGADRPPPDLLAETARGARGGPGHSGLGLPARRDGAWLALCGKWQRRTAPRAALGEVKGVFGRKRSSSSHNVVIPAKAGTQSVRR